MASDILGEVMDILDGAVRYERYVASLCPFHEDNRPSFMAWENFYRCYSCGATGRTEDLLHLVGGLPTQPRRESHFRNPWRGWVKKHGRVGLVLKAANEHLPCDYFSKRGVDEDQQRKLRLGYLSDWYTIPFFDRYGTIMGAIARRGEDNLSPAKYVTPPKQNNRRLIYVPDWELLGQRREIIVTFGIFDAITLAINGIASISIIGLFIDPTVFDFFRKHIYIVPDRKEEKFALQLASKLGWRGHVLRFNYPEGTKDLNDVYTQDPQLIISAFKGMKNDNELARCIGDRDGVSAKRALG